MNCLDALRRYGLCAFAATTVMLTPSCGKKEKATVQGPVRVDVQVIGGAGVRAATDQSFSGTIVSADESPVSFKVPGTIEQILVEEGQQVQKGQVLARVGSADLVNASNIAQAELEEARDAYARMKKLHDANALPEIKWVEVQSKLKQAENAAELARRDVADATLRAPISGYVASRLADAGQNVLPSEPVLKLVNVGRLQAVISVPEEEIAAFRPGAVAEVSFSALGGLSVEGKLGQKAVVADPLTRSYSVKFDIPNPDSRILPGMIASVSVGGLANPDATQTVCVLPAQSVLLSSDNTLFVWTVKDGKAQRKAVTADELAAGGVVVRSGLAAGDTVIVSGMQKVSTGTDVIVAQ